MVNANCGFWNSSPTFAVAFWPPLYHTNTINDAVAGSRCSQFSHTTCSTFPDSLTNANHVVLQKFWSLCVIIPGCPFTIYNLGKLWNWRGYRNRHDLFIGPLSALNAGEKPIDIQISHRYTWASIIGSIPIQHDYLIHNRRQIIRPINLPWTVVARQKSGVLQKLTIDIPKQFVSFPNVVI